MGVKISTWEFGGECWNKRRGHTSSSKGEVTKVTKNIYGAILLCQESHADWRVSRRSPKPVRMNGSETQRLKEKGSLHKLSPGKHRCFLSLDRVPTTDLSTVPSKALHTEMGERSP